jgi:hypothetical protein
MKHLAVVGTSLNVRPPLCFKKQVFHDACIGFTEPESEACLRQPAGFTDTTCRKKLLFPPHCAG